MRAAWNRKDAEEISRLSLHLTKQEARKAVARLALAQPAAKRIERKSQLWFSRKAQLASRSALPGVDLTQAIHGMSFYTMTMALRLRNVRAALE